MGIFCIPSIRKLIQFYNHTQLVIKTPITNSYAKVLKMDCENWRHKWTILFAFFQKPPVTIPLNCQGSKQIDSWNLKSNVGIQSFHIYQTTFRASSNSQPFFKCGPHCSPSFFNSDDWIIRFMWVTFKSPPIRV
jgi:hypothetical protein